MLLAAWAVGRWAGGCQSLVPSCEPQSQPALSCPALQRGCGLGTGAFPPEWERSVGEDSTPAAWVVAWDEFSSCEQEQLLCVWWGVLTAPGLRKEPKAFLGSLLQSNFFPFESLSEVSFV